MVGVASPNMREAAASSASVVRNNAQMQNRYEKRAQVVMSPPGL